MFACSFCPGQEFKKRNDINRHLKKHVPIGKYIKSVLCTISFPFPVLPVCFPPSSPILHFEYSFPYPGGETYVPSAGYLAVITIPSGGYSANGIWVLRRVSESFPIIIFPGLWLLFCFEKNKKTNGVIGNVFIDPVQTLTATFLTIKFIGYPRGVLGFPSSIYDHRLVVKEMVYQ